MVSCKSSEIGMEIGMVMRMDPLHQKSTILSTVSNLGYVWVHIEFITMVYTECYVFDSLYLTEAPPLKLVKYTKRQVLDKIEALQGDLYSEVLTLTREEKDEQREQEQIQQEKEAQQRADAKAVEEAKKHKEEKGFQKSSGNGETEGGRLVYPNEWVSTNLHNVW